MVLRLTSSDSDIPASLHGARSCGQACQITHNPPTLPPPSIQARKTHVCRVAEEVSTNGVATSAATVMDYDELTDILR